MDRLTQTYIDGTYGVANKLTCGENSYAFKKMLIDALGKYEDLEKQGRLLRPTVIARDIVYCVDFTNKLIEPSKILKISYIDGFEYDSDEMYFCQEDIGESVFLTKEEAEKKLEEVKESGKDK